MLTGPLARHAASDLPGGPGAEQRARGSVSVPAGLHQRARAKFWFAGALGSACFTLLACTASPAIGQQPPAPAGKSGQSGGWSAEVAPRAPITARPKATSLRISGDATRTSVRMEVSQPIVASMFTIDEPYRVIIDVPDLDFQFRSGASAGATGLVAAYRYGQFEAGRSRVVIDLSAPANIDKAMFIAPAGKEPGVLSFDLIRVGAAEFKAMRGSTSDASPPPAAAPGQLRGARHDETPAGNPAAPSPKTRPVVVIDPGHGGIDPGTVAGQGLTEKAVTLSVATIVRNLLVQSGRYDVHLTRQTDTFVSLDQRVRFSRQLQADLFVSIHADSLAEKDQAQSVRGATVYILSESASDDVARRLADKENAADVIAGLSSVPQSAEDQVRNILLDLVQRETANYSSSFRGLLLKNLQGRVPLAKDPQRSAAFRVLKQPDVPSVLIELGYMSNAQDLAMLAKQEGQKQVASAIASAVDAFFAKRNAGAKR